MVSLIQQPMVIGLPDIFSLFTMAVVKPFVSYSAVIRSTVVFRFGSTAAAFLAVWAARVLS